MSRLSKLSFAGVLVLLTLPLVVKADVSELKTAVVKSEEVSEYQMFDGQIEAVNKSTVSAQTGGVISKLNYDVGDYAKKGSLIARISSKNQKSGLQQAQAAVNEAKASISHSNASIVQAEATTREATANYAAARAEFYRVKGLFNKRILTKSAYDKAEAAMKSSLARVQSAKASLNAAKASRAAANSGLLAARAGLSKAGEQLGYTEVIAPYSGIVTERHVELGEVVSAGKPIMTGISLKQLRVVTDVPQRMINGIRKLKSATVYVDTINDNDKGGDLALPVKDINFFPYADSSTNAFRVRATLDSAVEGLFPGVFVKINFNIGKEKHLVVPQDVVAYRSEVTGIYVINKDGLPLLRQIRLGKMTENGNIRVLAGLDEGEEIALDPSHAAVYLKQKQLDKQRNGQAHD